DVYRDALATLTQVDNASNDYRSSKHDFAQSIEQIKQLESRGSDDYRRIQKIEDLMANFTQVFENKLMPMIHDDVAMLSNIKQ
ncbi:methyl-accepting chemotaxis protein, partial [Vibrio sp. 10N.222.55.E8]